MNDTAVAGSQLLTRLRSIVESTALASAVIVSTLVMTVTDSAAASDSVLDRSHTVLVDGASASAVVQGWVRAQVLVDDRAARASDTVRDAYRLLLTDGALAHEEVLARTGFVVSDGARANEGIFDRRIRHTLALDGAQAWDALPFRVRDVVVAGARADDGAAGVLHGRERVQDAAVASDEPLARVVQALVLVESARAGGEAFGVLHARDLVVDLPAAAHDEMFGGALAGQAWTAAAGEWAMSRWLVGLTGLAVVNGVLYATSPQGVFALDGQDEDITGVLRTGAIDMTGGRLGTPHAAYLEYELAGPAPAAAVTVTTTQSGAPAGYTYPFALRPVAGSLTNARALLGRGLRGRHFAFALHVSGTRAYINDWGVLVAPGSRRV